MRDPERISPIIRELEYLWSKYPDLRLGQLISALCRGVDPFYVEDNIIESRIRSVSKQGWDNND